MSIYLGEQTVFRGSESTGASDYTELTNKPSINSVTLNGNKTAVELGLMSNSNFIPKDTVITVRLDGSGDFTSIKDAVNFLTGKYSNGTVTINIGAGAYTYSSSITFYSNNFNFGLLNVQGAGLNNTIIVNTNNTVANEAFNVLFKGTPVQIMDLTVQAQSKPNYDSYGITSNNANVIIARCKTANFGKAGFYSKWGGDMVITDSIECSNCSTGVLADNGRVETKANSTFTFNNITNGLEVWGGGYIGLRNVKKTFTSVTNVTSQSLNTIGNQGIITGTFSN